MGFPGNFTFRVQYLSQRSFGFDTSKIPKPSPFEPSAVAIPTSGLFGRSFDSHIPQSDFRFTALNQEAETENRGTPGGSNALRRNDGISFFPTKPEFLPTAQANRITAASLTPAPPVPTVDGPIPMELDSQRLGRLSPEEKAIYVREGRCFRCRWKGHEKRDCTGTNSLVARMDV
jgi:hypothetical protein